MKPSEIKKYDLLSKEGYFEKKCLFHSQKKIFNLLSPQKGKKILDIGCGSGRYLIFFKKRGLLPSGLDISPTQIEKCWKAGLKNVKTWDAQKTPLPFEENFDYFLCLDVLEHLNQPEKAIKNIAQKLKGNATGIITTPCLNLPNIKFLISLYRKLINRDAEKAGHLRIFSEKKLLKILDKYFTIEQIRYKNCVGEILKSHFNKDFNIFNVLFDISSIYPLRLILKYSGASIFIKVRKKATETNKD